MANSNSGNIRDDSATTDQDMESWPGPYYCHTCDQEIPECTPEFTCPQCSGGFIEPIRTLSNTNGAYPENMDVSEEEAGNISFSIDHVSNANPTARPMRRGVRRTRIAIHRIQAGQDQDPNQIIQGFFQQFMNGLMGNTQNPINIQFPTMTFNADDFVWTRGGLDNIITMFMNQMDNTGPPPAPKDQIDALPDVPIQQSQIDKNVQCHVCMEDFVLNENVKQLPCNHLYHRDCIVPWLELHGTCPICRKRIDNLEQQRQTPTNINNNNGTSNNSTTVLTPPIVTTNTIEGTVNNGGTNTHPSTTNGNSTSHNSSISSSSSNSTSTQNNNSVHRYLDDINLD